MFLTEKQETAHNLQVQKISGFLTHWLWYVYLS